MLGACPSCGVALVPGYVRCPRCHRSLPMTRSRLNPGGTAVAAVRSNAPVLAIVGLVGLVIVAAIVYALLRKAPAPSAGAETSATSHAPLPVPVPGPVTAAPPAASPLAAAAVPTTPSAGAAANDLERDLQHRHLWSTVEIVGDGVDVRSSTCRDPAMKPVLDRAAGDFKLAGLHRLRCLEESGKLVFTRDL